MSEFEIRGAITVRFADPAMLVDEGDCNVRRRVEERLAHILTRDLAPSSAPQVTLSAPNKPVGTVESRVLLRRAARRQWADHPKVWLPSGGEMDVRIDENGGTYVSAWVRVDTSDA